MIAPSMVKQVRDLLAERKWSQRKIAKMMGVSRGTVGAIASGKRTDHDRLPRVKPDEPDRPTGPPERCPGCGGIVYMPCRLCRVRELLKKASKTPWRGRAEKGTRFNLPERPGGCFAQIKPGPFFGSEDPLQLDLREEHRVRYEQVRARRMQEQPVR